MAKLSDNLVYWAARGGTGLAEGMTFAAADRLGASLGSLAHSLMWSRRRIAMENLRRGMGTELTEDRRRGVTRAVFKNIGRTMVEFARLGEYNNELGRRWLSCEGRDYLEQVHREGRGGIVTTAHFGNWELAGLWITSKGYPLDYLVGEQHNERVDDMFNDFRRRLGVGIIPLRTSIRSIFKSLKNNRFVALVSDQHAPSGGIPVDFFGRKAATPKGPAAFALKAGCPILPYCVRRESYDRHVLMPGEPIYPPNTGDNETDIETMTVAYTSYFESCIRRFPDQWMWTHRRWKLPE
jgi:KDO2-lipid IV(A) lauroyltransferase